MNCFTKFLLIGLTASIFSSCQYRDDKYKVGQVWYYETRVNEPASTLTVVALENHDELGVIVSVYVDKLKINSGEFVFNEINHLPMSKAAMDSSITRIKNHVTSLPEYKESYKEWKEMFKTDQGKIFDVSVKEVIDMTEKELRKQST